VDVVGNYYFISGRRGDRSKDPNKYLKDALVLEKASEKALAEGDPLYNRYIFYCAQSYNSCNNHEKAIEFYKKALTLPLWIQEKYVACMEIYDQYEILKKPEEGLRYLVESYKHDPTRIECYYRLIKYYCINGLAEVAYAYYTVIKDFYENRYNPIALCQKLFARRSEFDFYLPYYMVIVSERTKRLDTCAKMYELIFKYRFLASEWWLKNLFHNIQFCANQLPLTLDFLESMLSYIDLIRRAGVKLEGSHFLKVSKIIDRYRPLLSDLKPELKIVCALTEARFSGKRPTIMLTITTCKRLDFFIKTMNSILSMWTDIDKIDYFYCVDDNSSSEDRLIMQQHYPFFHYYMKTPNERGHRESMNLIWQKLAELKPTYWIHLEDDWLYFKKDSYVTRALDVLTKYESENVHQVVFNKNYGLAFCDLDRVGGLMLNPGTVLHEKRDGLVGKNCGYWPHYSLQPSMVRTRVALDLGNYDSPNKFFERDYADRYYAKGYMTAFFNSIYSIHIGKQHWEKEGKNAYALNEVSQFNENGNILEP
jgi:tetratricopeptide (TPR) repeat protein